MPYIDYQELAALDARIRNEVVVPQVVWQSAGHSHVGRVRQLNEDAFFNSTDLGLWAVADGMGGHSRGDYASKVVVESLVHFAVQQSLPETIVHLEARLREAHGICRSTFRGERVGSTVAALLSYSPYVFCVWAGDSRIYRLRENRLKLMTRDNTVAQEKYARGELTASQAATHPTANILTRAVGVHQTLHLDLDFDRVAPEDRYLICSDGLYNHLSFADIERYLSGPTAQALDTLVDRALQAGGRDNITAIITEALPVAVDS